MTWLSRLLAVAAIVAPAAIIAPANATPYPVQYNFWGVVVNGNSPWAPQNSKFTGYFRYDGATKPSSPGMWDLPTAEFHVDFAHLTIDTMGATANTWALGEAITFQSWVPLNQIPFPVTYDAYLDMQFDTYKDGYFSPWKLPTTETPGDHSLFFFIDNNLFVGTDTAFNPSVPEPATVALFLAGLMGLAWGVRRRSSPKPSSRSSVHCAG